MVCSEHTRVYTSSGRMSLRPVCCCLCYWHLVCSRGYKWVREGKDPKSLVEGVNGCLELDRCSAVCSCHALVFFISWFESRADLDPLVGAPCFPFYRRRESVGYNEEKGEEREREEGFQDRRVLLLLYVGPTDPVDVNRDGSTSWPYSSLALCAGIICRSWCSIPSQRTSW